MPAQGPVGTPQHWDSIEAALADLSSPRWSWEAALSSQTCAACVNASRCLTRGHDWGDWQSMASLGEPDLAIRLCASCGRDEVTSAECLVPAGQPDASWWPGARVASGAAASLAVGCGILLLARGVSWLMGRPGPHAGRPGDG